MPGSRRKCELLLACLVLSASAALGQADDLAARAAEGKKLMAAGRYEEAAAIYGQLVKAAPGNPGLLMNLGLAQHYAGRDTEAAAVMEAVLKSQPNAVPALITLGSIKLSSKRPAEAVAFFRKAVTMAPGDHETRGMLASALLESRRLDEAATEYRKLTDATPDDPRPWYGLGMTYQATAAEAFDRLQKLDATSPYVSALVAETRVQRRQFRSAFFFYGEASKKLPNLHGIHAALADVYRKTGHADWAAEEDARERALPAADCKEHAAECQFAGGHDLQILTMPLREASAETLYWRAKAANELAMQSLFRLGQLPPSPQLHQLRAEIARGQGQHLESIAEYRAALELRPGDPSLRQELATSFFLAQDYRAALAEVEALLKVSPRSPELNFVAGDSLLRLEDPEKAIPYLRTALRSDPQLVAAGASLGLALSRLGKQAEAVPFLEKALELDDDGSLYYQLGRAYQATGASEKASAAMAKYQELQKRNQEQKEEVAREAQIGPPR